MTRKNRTNVLYCYLRIQQYKTRHTLDDYCANGLLEAKSIVDEFKDCFEDIGVHEYLVEEVKRSLVSSAKLNVFWEIESVLYFEMRLVDLEDFYASNFYMELLAALKKKPLLETKQFLDNLLYSESLEGFVHKEMTHDAGNVKFWKHVMENCIPIFMDTDDTGSRTASSKCDAQANARKLYNLHLAEKSTKLATAVSKQTSDLILASISVGGHESYGTSILENAFKAAADEVLLYLKQSVVPKFEQSDDYYRFMLQYHAGDKKTEQRTYMEMNAVHHRLDATADIVVYPVLQRKQLPMKKHLQVEHQQHEQQAEKEQNLSFLSFQLAVGTSENQSLNMEMGGASFHYAKINIQNVNAQLDYMLKFCTLPGIPIRCPALLSPRRQEHFPSNTAPPPMLYDVIVPLNLEDATSRLYGCCCVTWAPSSIQVPLRRTSINKDATSSTTTEAIVHLPSYYCVFHSNNNISSMRDTLQEHFGKSVTTPCNEDLEKQVQSRLESTACENSTDIFTLFRMVDLTNIFLILNALLLEKKVVLISNQRSLLIRISEALLAMLQPLQYMGLYIPYCPPTVSEKIVESTACQGFLIGFQGTLEFQHSKQGGKKHIADNHLCNLKKCMLKLVCEDDIVHGNMELLKDSILLDIEKDEVYCPQHQIEMPVLPEIADQTLLSIRCALAPNIFYDQITGNEEDHIRIALREFIENLASGVRECCYTFYFEGRQFLTVEVQKLLQQREAPREADFFSDFYRTKGFCNFAVKSCV